MRILHTSDWHLGRSFGPISLADDQQAFLDWLVQLCAAEAVDLVVVAGDLYDRSIPPTEAVVMFRQALVRLQAAGHTVAVITGNHDGADRVAAYDELLDASRVYVRGGYAKVAEVVSLQFADGPLDLVLLPFLDPQAAPDDLVDATVTADDDTTDRRVRRTHQSVLESAVMQVQPKLVSPRSLAVAHAFVAGGEESESERQLTVGGTGQVAATVFAPFSYTALGHLHRPQRIGATIVYSGTPLAYSFSEVHPKSVTLVDMAADGGCEVRQVDIPVGRPVLTVTGSMAELLAATPDARAAGSFVRAIVTDRETVLDAKARLAQVFPNVVEVKLQPHGVFPGGSDAPAGVRELSPLEATRQFWLAAEGSAPDDAIVDLLEQVVTAAVQQVTV